LVDLTGKAVAQFVQTVSLWQGAKTIEIEIELISLFAELATDPWNSYFGARFAWPSSAAELRRSVHGCSVSTHVPRLEAPQFVEIVDGSLRTAIVTGGHVYHRRSSDRMLDSILKVRGETATQFRLSVGIDVPHVWKAAQEQFLPPTAIYGGGRSAGTNSSGWLFHIDAPNLMATHWSPLAEGGKVVGFRVRLLETEARRGPVRVRCFRQPMSAERVDLAGKPHSELTIDEGAVVCEIGPYEWIQIEARW
jgi:alpha-mannosidase